VRKNTNDLQKQDVPQCYFALLRVTKEQMLLHLLCTVASMKVQSHSEGPSQVSTPTFSVWNNPVNSLVMEVLDRNQA